MTAAQTLEREASPGAARPLPGWLEGAGVTGLCLIFLVNVLAGAALKSATEDEGMHLLYGRLFLSHQLAKIRGVTDGKGAVPALAALTVELRRAVAKHPEQVDELFWGRLPTVFLGVALLVTLWGLARWLAGREAGLVAAWFAAWCPNLIAHSKWVTFDIAATLGFVLGVFAMVAYLVRPTLARGSLLVAALGVAQLAKVSNLSLFGLFVVFTLGALAWKRRQGSESGTLWRLTARHLGVLVAGVLFTVALLNTVYGSWGRWEPVAAVAPPSTVPAAVTASPSVAAAVLPLPPDYVYEFLAGVEHNRRGHPAYFHGAHGTRGWVLYFPAALLLKTPLPLLLLFGLAIIARCVGWIKPSGRDLAVASAAALLLGYFMVGIHVDIGMRYVLPVYALCLALAATSIAAARGRRRRLVLWAVLLLGGWQAVESAAAFPHHLSYFNELAGGPTGGWHWFNDSNLSWGQDAYYLRSWLDGQHEPVAVNPRAPTTGLIAIDVNELTGLTAEEAARSAWLRDNYEPVGYITPAWPIFRVPDDARFRRLAAAWGAPPRQRETQDARRSSSPAHPAEK